MKKLITMFIFLLCLTLSSIACPSYTLVDKTPEELESEFNELISILDNDFLLLKENFGAHSYIEFKNLISNWMTLYTKYECWLDVTEKKLAKTPMPKNRKWFEELKDISINLGQAIIKFNEKDYIHARKIFLKSYNEFILTFKSNKYKQEKEMIEFYVEFIKSSKWNELITYHRDNEKKLLEVQNYIKEKAKTKILKDYYTKFNSFYKKLEQSIDNEEKLNYTKDELLQLINNFTFYRYENIEAIKKMWSEEFQ
ncbi:MAG: hypothetical protein M0R46_05760 [Candidatus Muirbacterium halophilum]|nr:hypothetical protein [Candidatus Muirbacterium halophilum]